MNHRLWCDFSLLHTCTSREQRKFARLSLEKMHVTVRIFISLSGQRNKVERGRERKKKKPHKDVTNDPL